MIKIYSKPDCHPCQASKKWLDDRDIDYTEINVKTREGAREFRELKIEGKSVPLILTGRSTPDNEQIALRYFDHELFNVLWGGQNGTSANE